MESFWQRNNRGDRHLFKTWLFLQFSPVDGCERVSGTSGPVRNVQMRNHTPRTFVISPLIHIHQKEKNKP